jgi:hypothetical protein
VVVGAAVVVMVAVTSAAVSGGKLIPPMAAAVAMGIAHQNEVELLEEDRNVSLNEPRDDLSMRCEIAVHACVCGCYVRESV